MMRAFWSLLVLTVLGRGAWAFKAAVYEHVQMGNPFNETREVVVAKNLAVYAEAAREAAARNAEMIVFPEDGIMFGFLKWDDVNKTAEDVPNVGAVPCLDAKDHLPVLKNLSCLARENQMYLVANLVDKKPCTKGPCPGNNTFFYNTNVAFDRNGTLVSRYHKNHLFIEPFMSEPDPPEFGVFETDFGVRAGMFICFDMLFKEASELVTRHNVTLAITSTWWFDELPARYSVAIQQAWSLRHGVPLLAAGIQRISSGSLGSGIYGGLRGPLNYTYSPDGLPKLLITKLDVTPEHPRYSGDVVSPEYRHFKNLYNRPYISQALWDSIGKYQVCNGDFCCRLHYKTSQINDQFFLFAHDGFDRIKGLWDLRVQTCIVAVCEDPELKQCRNFSTTSSTTFTEFRLEAQFRTAEVFPLLASTGLELTPKQHWKFEMTKSNVGVITMDKDNPSEKPLLQATLTARLYSEDRKL